MSSFVLDSISSCPAIQEGLDMAWQNMNNIAPTPVPSLEYVWSEQNTSFALKKAINYKQGKYRPVNVEYVQRRISSNFSASTVQDCNGGEMLGDFTKQYTIDTTTGAATVPFSIAPVDLFANCVDNMDWWNRIILNYIFGLEWQMNTQLLVSLAANIGKWPNRGGLSVGGSKTKLSTKTLNSSAQPVTNFVEDVSFATGLSTMNVGAPVVIGGTQDFANYFNGMPARCCNTLTGLDLNTLFQNVDRMLPIWDGELHSILDSTNNNSNFLILEQGAVQPIFINQFEGSLNDINVPGFYVQGVIRSPRTGIPFDYLMKLDCGQYNLQLKLAHQYVYYPTDAFQNGDFMSGVTGVYQGQISN